MTAPRVPIQEWFGDADGNPLVSLAVHIYAPGTTTAVTVYTTETGTTTASNPASTDSTGRILVWAPEGAYDVQATGGAAQRRNLVPALGLPDYLNVKAFGAKGDGATDDKDAITDAIAVADAAGGGVVYFPAGTYITSVALELKSNLTLLGGGAGVSIIKAKSGSGSGANITAVLRCDSGSGGTKSNITIDSLEVDGNNAGRSSLSGDNRCIAFVGGAYQSSCVEVRNCYVHDAPTDGIVFDSCVGAKAIENVVKDCVGRGIAFLHDSTALMAQGNRISDCSGELLAFVALDVADQAYDMTNVVATANQLRNGLAPSGGPNPPALRVAGVSAAVISANLISSTAGPGIAVTDTFDHGTADVTVDANVLSAIGANVDGDPAAEEIPGILIRNALPEGHEGAVERCTVANNCIDSTYGPCILVLSAAKYPGTSFQDILIATNEAHLAGAEFPGTGSSAGILADNSASEDAELIGLVIDGNTVTECLGNGIQIGTGEDSHVTCRILNNGAYDNGTGGDTPSFDGKGVSSWHR